VSFPPRRGSPGRPFGAALASVIVVEALAVQLFLPVMPQIKTAFGVSDALVGLTFSVALGVMALVTLVYGSLSDRYGRRPMLLAGLALLIAGSAVAALAGSFASLIAGRVLQALGAGCCTALARVIARDAYGSGALVRAITYLSMASCLGPIVFPLIGGMLID